MNDCGEPLSGGGRREPVWLTTIPTTDYQPLTTAFRWMPLSLVAGYISHNKEATSEFAHSLISRLLSANDSSLNPGERNTLDIDGSVLDRPAIEDLEQYSLEESEVTETREDT